MRGKRRRARFSWPELRRIWITPVFILAAATVLSLGTAFTYDWFFHRPDDARGLGPLALLVNYDLDTLQEAFGNLAQTLAAVVGIVITVVAIVVQLAATRYTPRVTELFLKDKTNFLVLGFFLVNCVAAIWISLAMGNDFLPRASVLASVVGVTFSLLLIMPYFVYVFDFLDPEKVVSRIQQDALEAATPPIRDVEAAQVKVLQAIEQLADIAVAAVSAQDKIISARAVDAMRALVVSYTEFKPELTERWHLPGVGISRDPDFVAMNPDALDDLVRDALWLEWKVLRQYQGIYNGALDGSPDMNYLIAINARYLGEAALAHGSEGAAALVIKFFNTFLRATLNKKQVRTAYNVMNQYRQLVEAALMSERDALVGEIASYFKYYGQVAEAAGLSFVTETIAYDLASLCELAHTRRSPVHGTLLAALLEMDREAEDEAADAALRGVRKAQLRLAAFYLERQDEPSARRIHRDMELERPERLVSLRRELLRVMSKDFWEVIDRGANFDYMPPERRAHLETFFAWFPWRYDAISSETRSLPRRAPGESASPRPPARNGPSRPSAQGGPSRAPVKGGASERRGPA